MSTERKFRFSMPVVTLPPDRGGKKAVVFFSKAVVDNPLVQYSTCMDIDGGIHQDVPFHISAIRAGAMVQRHFVEVESAEGPEAKIIVLPGGR